MRCEVNKRYLHYVQVYAAGVKMKLENLCLYQALFQNNFVSDNQVC